MRITKAPYATGKVWETGGRLQGGPTGDPKAPAVLHVEFLRAVRQIGRDKYGAKGGGQFDGYAYPYLYAAIHKYSNAVFVPYDVLKVLGVLDT